MRKAQRLPNLPFVLTALCFALSGCGGGSNSIAEDPLAGLGADEIINCTGDNCVGVILDETPIQNLNYVCGSVRGITNNQGLAVCPLDSKVTYYLKKSGVENTITLGETPTLSGLIGSQTALRFSLLDLTNTTNNTEITSIDDSNAKTAVNLGRFLYSINSNNYVSDLPVNRIVISAETKELLSELAESVSAEDFETDAYVAKVEPFLAAANKSLIAIDEVKARMHRTMMELNAGMLSHSPETGVVFGQLLTGSTSPDNPFATLSSYYGISRSGHSFGFGLEWVANIDSTNNRYVTYLRNNYDKTDYVSGNIDPYTKVLNSLSYNVVEGEYQGNQVRFSGKLLRDAAIIYTAEQYQSLLGSDAAVEAQDFGQWTQPGSTESFKGSAYFFKTDQANTYLDNAVWKVEENVGEGQRYHFPLYAQVVLSNREDYVEECRKLSSAAECPSEQTVNIAILEDGDIVSADAADGVSASCVGLKDRSSLVDLNGVQQQMLGTVRAATRYSENNKIILPFIMLSGEKYRARGLDGVVLGSQESPITTFKINVAGLDNQNGNISATATNNPDISEPAYWFNRYNYFTFQLVSQAAADEENEEVTDKVTVTAEQEALAKNVSNTFQVKVAPCYSYPVKANPIVN